jgi:hypothetical protein
MTTTNPPTPAAFTSDDFAARMSRVASSVAEEGLAGLIVTPGPDSRGAPQGTHLDDSSLPAVKGTSQLTIGQSGRQHLTRYGRLMFPDASMQWQHSHQ